MLVNVVCKKCGNHGKLDIGDMTAEEVKKVMGNLKSWHCDLGNHMELTSPLNFYEFDWEHLEKGNAPTEEEFLNNLKQKYSEVLTTKELTEKYNVEGFMYGLCGCNSKENHESAVFSFVHSPKGERYYIR